MKTFNYYVAGSTGALDYCKKYLRSHRCSISTVPNEAITHLILPAPAFEPDGKIKGGGYLETLLRQFPDSITVMGGNLNHPALVNYKTVDLLQDPLYLAENADLTAHCAIKAALNRMNTTFKDCPVLVIGWGRIGKCLARLLRNLGAKVSVSARKDSDRAMLLALGYETADITPPAYDLMRFRIIFNTVPVMILPESSQEHCRSDCIKIDLASTPGMGGMDIVWAKGLPNKEAPESSGILMGRTILRLAQGKEIEK